MTTRESRGPATDAEVFARVRRALDDIPTLSTTIRVHVEDGLAWLTGLARRHGERAQAEAIVRQVPGVREVVNKITVVENPAEEGADLPCP